MRTPWALPITFVETVLDVDVPAELEQVKVKLFDPSESSVIDSDPSKDADPFDGVEIETDNP